jgi:hypothetical protein
MKLEEDTSQSGWQQRKFPGNTHTALSSVPPGGSRSRVDFSAFINSMDDKSFSYLCLIREYATRVLQGRAAEYSGLYKAIASQTAEEEDVCRISVIEFEESGLRSKTFVAFYEFKNYIDETTTISKALKRLFVLEDMPVRYICLLGSRLRIHPTLFARHYSTEDSSTYHIRQHQLSSFHSPDQYE